MATLVLFIVFGLLILAMLVLVFVVYLLDCFINKQSKRLQDLMRSGSHPPSIRKETLSMGTTPCETCHTCGGLRLRLPQTSISAVMADKMKSSESSNVVDYSVSDNVTKSPSSPPWDHWLAVKSRVASKAKQMFQRSFIRPKRQSQGGILESLQSLNRSLGCNGQVRVVESISSTPECGFASDGSVIGSSDSAQRSSIAERESTSSSLGLSSSHSESHFQPDILKNPDVHKKNDADVNDAPVRKLVLEILMSHSRNADDKCHNSSSSTPSASSLRLKLEASSNLEQLLGYAEPFRSKGFHTCKDINKDGNSASLLYHPGDTASAYEGSLGLNTAASVPHVCGKCVGHYGQSGVTGNSAGDMMLGDGDSFHAMKMVIIDGLKDRDECVRSRHNDMECNSLSLLDSVPNDDRLKHSTRNGELKVRFYNEVNEGIASKPTPPSVEESKEVSSLVSAMGSLRITFLKTDNEAKMQSEGVQKCNGQVGSPLASINVSGKLAGSSGLGRGKREKMKKTGHSVHSGSFSPELAGGVMEGSVHTYSQAMDEVASTVKSSYDNASPSSKEEKKKKKSRGKKARSKSGPLVSNLCKMQEFVEAIKHVSPVPEKEIGCVCGASKGGPHAESCPYPFTSAGSMLQRKIKEQYDILVKSNAAKTLTLTQVGQFTTCLVEAKATLQQKSEMIQRKFTIAKSLLSKADKSSFDRLCGQIRSLEMEQKRLEEDTAVYNRLQEQLKLSPAYKKMLEYGRAHFEVQPHTGQMIEKLEPEDMEMSFEELLAQEKKDGFWKRHSLARSEGVPAS